MFIRSVWLLIGFIANTSTAKVLEQKGGANETVKQGVYNISELCAAPCSCSQQIVQRMDLLQELQHQYDDSNLKYTKTWIPAYFHNATFIKRSYVKILERLVSNASQSCVSSWTLALEQERAQLEQVEGEDKVVLIAESWVHYVLPPFVFSVVIVGIPFNVVLMVIITRHREMRTCANMILLNLSIGDTLFLVIHVVLNYIQVSREIELSEPACCVYAYINALSTNLSVYSMVVLSFKRYMASRRTLPSGSVLNPVYLVMSVWVLAGLAALFAVTYRRPRLRCFLDVSAVLVVCDFVFTCILPMLVILGFYLSASRSLRYSVRNMPGEASGLRRVRRHRERGASVLPALAVVFAITYLPLYTLDTIQFLSGFSYTSSAVLMHLYHVTVLLFPLNSGLNPIALCVASSSFRLHFRNYFLCKCLKKNARSYRKQSRLTSVTRNVENVF